MSIVQGRIVCLACCTWGDRSRKLSTQGWFSCRTAVIGSSQPAKTKRTPRPPCTCSNQPSPVQQKSSTAATNVPSNYTRKPCKITPSSNTKTSSSTPSTTALTISYTQFLCQESIARSLTSTRLGCMMRGKSLIINPWMSSRNDHLFYAIVLFVYYLSI